MKDAKALGREKLGQGPRNLAVAAFRERLFGRMALGSLKGKRVLDLGCGDGIEAEHFARLGAQVDAFDIEAHPAWGQVQRASKGRIRFKRVSAEALPKLKGRWDLVFQKDVLHHVADPASLLVQMARLTKPGGSAWVLECNRLNPVSYLHLTLWGGHQHFTPWRLERLLEGAGLHHAVWLKVEARVWPLQSAAFQAFINRVQDLVQALPGLRHLAVYHLIRWDKPTTKGKP